MANNGPAQPVVEGRTSQEEQLAREARNTKLLSRMGNMAFNVVEMGTPVEYARKWGDQWPTLLTSPAQLCV
jgi:hypothetical protein